MFMNLRRTSQKKHAPKPIPQVRHERPDTPYLPRWGHSAEGDEWMLEMLGIAFPSGETALDCVDPPVILISPRRVPPRDRWTGGHTSD